MELREKLTERESALSRYRWPPRQPLGSVPSMFATRVM
jgi:hypothetical protein